MKATKIGLRRVRDMGKVGDRHELSKWLNDHGFKSVVICDGEITINLQTLANLVADFEEHHNALHLVTFVLRNHAHLGEQMQSMVLQKYCERDHPGESRDPVSPNEGDIPVVASEPEEEAEQVETVKHARIEDSGSVFVGNRKNLS